MAYTDTIYNDRLSITFRLPRKDILFSKRFDSAGCIERVVLDGKHQFCEPEMVVVGRPDTHGTGLVDRTVHLPGTVYTIYTVARRNRQCSV